MPPACLAVKTKNTHEHARGVRTDRNEAISRNPALNSVSMALNIRTAPASALSLTSGFKLVSICAPDSRS